MIRRNSFSTLISVLLMLAILLPLAQSPSVAMSHSTTVNVDAWWNRSWRFRREINVTEKAGYTVIYPVVITLNQTLLQRVSPSGRDIRFIANGRELQYDVKQWDYNKSATIWVLCNLTAYMTSTIYMYYGNDNATDNQSQITTTISGITSYDSSFYGNNGTIYGATPTLGRVFNGLDFDGVDDYVDVPNSANLNPVNQITVEAWIKPKNVSGFRDIVSKWEVEASANRAYVLQILNGMARFAISDDGTWKRYVAETPPILQPNQWYHLAGTYDGAKIRMYVNGKLEAERSISTTINSQEYPLKIGSLGTTSKGNWFNGTIDNVMIFNRALNASEIGYSYKYGSPLNPSGLVLWHKFDSSPIDTANITFGREELLSTITCSISKSAIIFGESAVISGAIRPTVINATVHILVSTDNVTFSNLIDISTDSEGNYSYQWTPSLTGPFYLKATWDGDIIHVGAESSILNMFVKRLSTITFSVLPLKIIDAFDITGSISPAHPETTVHILVSTDNVTFSNLIDISTDSEGNYSYRWTPSLTGLLFLKSSWDGDLDHFGAESIVQSIFVKERPTITCSVSPLEILEGEIVYVTGSIFPPKAEVTLTLTYENIRNDGLTRKYQLTKTDSNGFFSDAFKPPNSGSWRVIASWQGDENTTEAKSQPAVFSVNLSSHAPLYSLPIILAALISLTAIGAYFIVRRYGVTKRQEIKRTIPDSVHIYKGRASSMEKTYSAFTIFYVKLREHWLGFLVVIASTVMLFRDVLLSPGFPPGIDALAYIVGVASLTRNFRMFYIWGYNSFGSLYEFTWRSLLALINILINNAILIVNLFAATCYLLAGFSIYYFTYRLTGKKVAATAATVIFMVNQFFIGKWANGFYHAGFAYALTPLLFIALDSALRTRKLKWILAFSLAYSALFLTRYDPLIYITPFLPLYTAFVLVKPYNGIKRASIFKDAFRVWFTSIVLVALFSAFFLAPILFGARSAQAQLGFKVALETVKGVDEDFLHALFGFSTELSYLARTGRLSLYTCPLLPGPWYMFFMAIPAVLAFAALLFRRDRWTLFLASSALIAVFMAKGFGPPLGEVYEWLYFNVPFIGALHVPVRWLMITYFAYAFLAGVTVNAIYDGLRSFFNRYSGAFKRKVLGVLPSLVVVVILSSAVLPVSGIMAEGLQPWSPSSDLVDAYRWLADQPGDYRIVTVPYGQHRMWAYWEEQGKQWILHDLGAQSRFWHDKPIVGAKVDASYALNFVRYTESLVFAEKTNKLMNILGTFNVKYLLAQSYLPFEMGGSTNDFQERFFARQLGLKPVFTSGNTTVFENLFWTPHFFVAHRFIIVVGGLEAISILGESEDFSLRDYGLLFADQIIRNRGLGFFKNLLQDADACVFVNSETFDLAMLVLNNCVRIRAADYGYPSSAISRYWVYRGPLELSGMFTLNDRVLSTSGNNDISIPFKIESDGSYEVWVRILYGPDRGGLLVSSDGIPIGGIVPLQPEYRFKWVKLGQAQFEKGVHSFVFTNRKVSLEQTSSDVDEIVLVKTSVLKSAIDETIEMLKNASKVWRFTKQKSWVTTATLTEPNTVVENNSTVIKKRFWISNPECVKLSYVPIVGSNEKSAGSLRIELHSSRPRYSIIEHKFQTLQDWSRYKYLVLWFKGRNVGPSFEVVIYFNSWDNVAKFRFSDTSVDWRPIVLKLDEPYVKRGVINWSQVSYILLAHGNKDLKGFFRLGPIVLASNVTLKTEFNEQGVSLTTAPNVKREGEYTVTYFSVSEEKDEITMYYFGEHNKGGKANMVSYKQMSPTLYEVQVNATNPFMLMFSELYHPLWKAYVDGEEIDSIPSYFFINGFPITKTGDIRITVEFIGQRYVTIGAIVSTASLMTTLAFLTIKKKKERN
ncbi:MAG: DUF2341 domain-containing protein [Candidatus Bathyarchaeia archaeon]